MKCSKVKGIYMESQKLKEKINEIKNISEDQLSSWYRKNKKIASWIVESLSWLDLERDRHNRVQFRQAAWY
jgi:predicted component of viral defense system (DUF524 family)